MMKVINGFETYKLLSFYFLIILIEVRYLTITNPLIETTITEKFITGSLFTRQ